MSAAWTSTVVSVTERVLLMLGWERARAAKTPKNSKSVYHTGGKQPFATKTSATGDASSSSWEREKPSLKLRTVNPNVQRRSAPMQTWTSDAFDVASNTGTV